MWRCEGYEARLVKDTQKHSREQGEERREKRDVTGDVKGRGKTRQLFQIGLP